jgi:hypothetical protein
MFTVLIYAYNTHQVCYLPWSRDDTLTNQDNNDNNNNNNKNKNHNNNDDNNGGDQLGPLAKALMQLYLKIVYHALSWTQQRNVVDIMNTCAHYSVCSLR